MKTLFVSVLLSLVLGACNKPAEPDPRVAELEKTVESLKASLAKATSMYEGEVVKLQAIARMHDFDGNPLKDFFNAPEFWENTWNSGNSDCCKRCQGANTSAQAACAAISDEAQRLACYTEAARTVSNCVNACSASFPPDIEPRFP